MYTYTFTGFPTLRGPHINSSNNNPNNNSDNNPDNNPDNNHEFSRTKPYIASMRKRQ